MLTEKDSFLRKIPRLASKIDCEVLVVIPAMNEAASIGKIIDGVNSSLSNVNHKILVVDGKSTDGTDHITTSKGSLLIYQKGKGYGDALMTGFVYGKENTTAKVLVMIDADSTYAPQDVTRLVEPILNDEADFVIGNRFACMQKGSMTLVNRFGNRILSWLARRTLKIKFHDTQCGLRAFSTHLVDFINCRDGGMPFATEMLVDVMSASARIKEVPIKYFPRIGETKLNPLNDGARIISTILKLMRDTRPMTFFGLAGVILGITGLFFGIDVTLEYLETGKVGRLPTVMLSVLLLVSSVQIFSIGLIADMIKKYLKR